MAATHGPAVLAKAILASVQALVDREGSLNRNRDYLASRQICCAAWDKLSAETRAHREVLEQLAAIPLMHDADEDGHRVYSGDTTHRIHCGPDASRLYDLTYSCEYDTPEATLVAAYVDLGAAVQALALRKEHPRV